MMHLISAFFMCKDMSKDLTSFALNGIAAFERTHMSLFNQTNREIERLNRINEAIDFLEPLVLERDNLRALDARTQVFLLDVLSKNRQTTVGNLLQLSKVLSNIREIVGIQDGLQAYTALPGRASVGDFPGLEHDDLDDDL